MAAPPRDGKGRQASGSFDIHQMTHNQTQRENCILLSRAHGYMLPMTGPSVVDTLPTSSGMCSRYLLEDALGRLQGVTFLTSETFFHYLFTLSMLLSGTWSFGIELFTKGHAVPCHGDAQGLRALKPPWVRARSGPSARSRPSCPPCPPPPAHRARQLAGDAVNGLQVHSLEWTRVTHCSAGSRGGAWHDHRKCPPPFTQVGPFRDSSCPM